PSDDSARAPHARLRAIWYHPPGQAWDADRLPDAEIHNLSQLPEVLARRA
ncbi:HAD family hydrolase, partial [Pseudomonas syringae pv. tagetis]